MHIQKQFRDYHLLILLKIKKLKLILARLFHIYGEGEDSHRFWPSLVKAAKEGKDFKMTMEINYEILLMFNKR